MKKIYIEKNRIEEELAQSQSLQQCASNLGISLTPLKRLCQEYGLQRNTPYNARRGKELPLHCPEVTKEWMIENGVNTDKSMATLAKELGVAESTLDYRRHKGGLVKRFKHQVNRDILFNLEDPNIGYLAGLTATDGYLVKGVDAIEGALVGDDELVLLQQIRDYLQSNAPVGECGDRGNRLRICAEGIQGFFEEHFNIHKQQKTKTVEVPAKFPSTECARAYLRGCLDGDGYISKDGNRVELLTESEALVKGLAQIVGTYLEVEWPLRGERRKEKLYPIVSAVGDKARKILTGAYDQEGLHLQRKYNRYKAS